MFAHSFLVFNNRLIREALGGGDETSLLAFFLVSLYGTVLVVLSFYGGHRWMLMAKYLRGRGRRVSAPPSTPEEELPGITVQLPIYNEQYVVDRLLDHVGALDYPRDRLEVQVLDDSTDDTTRLVQAAVARWRRKGLDVTFLHRGERKGFKAGALDAGLKRARFDLVAVFDADFCPQPDFLRRLVPHFRDPRVGVVQARWGHLNGEDSLLTRVQGMMLDGHFLVEHPARNWNGLFFNFNGTGGIWRRQAIEEAGGWEHDTLTEDLDLSYRAQLKGWRFVYAADVICPAELPVEMNAFKCQQHRWAKGSVQVMKKLLPRLLSSDQPLRVKLEGFFHLTGNLCYLLMLVLCLLMYPMILMRARITDGTLGFAVDLGIFLCATASVIAFYAFSQVVGYRDWWRRVLMVPMMLAVGIGIGLNQARAVLEALLGRESEFVRTPKYNLGGGEDRRSWVTKTYRSVRNLQPWVEMAFALYFTLTVGYAVGEALWGTLPFLMLFFVGYWYVAILSLTQGRRAASDAPAPSPLPRGA